MKNPIIPFAPFLEAAIKDREREEALKEAEEKQRRRLRGGTRRRDPAAIESEC
jgi:hypothetical protein